METQIAGTGDKPSLAHSMIVTTGDDLKRPDFVFSDAQNNINAEYTTTVGVILRMTAHCTDPILRVEWSVEGFQLATVADYRPTTHFAQFTDLSQEDLQRNPIRFGWWKPGHYTVTCDVTTPGGTIRTTDIFVVTAPLVRDFNAFTGVVGVGKYNGLWFLRLARSMQQFQRDGILMNAIVAGTQHDAGILAGFHLANQQRFITKTNRHSFRLALNGTYVLDIGMTNSVEYQNIIVPLPVNGANVHFEPTDGPGIELNKDLIIAAMIGDGMPIVPERYSMNLMFKANVPEAVWVPLCVLAWSWEGTAEFSDGIWQPAQNTAVSAEEPAAPVNFPTWNTNTSDRQWVPY